MIIRAEQVSDLRLAKTPSAPLKRLPAIGIDAEGRPREAVQRPSRRATPARRRLGWWVLAERQVRAVVVVVLEELAQQSPQVLLIERDDVIE